MAILIINSGRCSHARCVFCGYGRIRGAEPTPGNVKEKMDAFLETLEEDTVKVFGSGSYLDDRQFPKQARQYFKEKLIEKNVKSITVESRPEYITEEVLAEFKGIDYTIAIGLESADNNLLKRLDKGYSKEEYAEAARIIHENNGKVRTYLLVNPPYAQDIQKELDDSVEYAIKHSDTIVLINTLPHGNAPLMRMWVDGIWNYLSKEEFQGIVGKHAGQKSIETDEETYRFIPNFPDHMKDDLDGVGEWHLTHPHYEVWHDYILRWYQPRPDRILLFLPCSYKKPYSLSQTHKAITSVLEKNMPRSFHEVMLSSAGVIPREFEAKYPFESYDWDERLETPKIKERYIQVTTERIKGYLTAHKKYYSKVACYLKYDSESYLALKDACGEVVNLLSESTYEQIKDKPKALQNPAALKDLEQGLNWCLQNST